jgi:hypothetical protein
MTQLQSIAELATAGEPSIPWEFQGRPPFSALRELVGAPTDLVEPLVSCARVLCTSCARALCTEGEIVDALRGVFGEHTETPHF